MCVYIYIYDRSRVRGQRCMACLRVNPKVPCSC